MVFSVDMIYQVEVLQLSPLQLVLVGTTLEVACFIFEIPTGIVADLYSRKLSVIIGLAMMGIGFTLEGLVPSFYAIIAAQVLWGIGYTFISGSTEAWVAGEVTDLKLDHIYLKGSQIGQAGSIAGIVIGTLIGGNLINLPIILSGGLHVLFALFLLRFMPEEHFICSASEDKNPLNNMVHTLKISIRYIRVNPIIILLLAVTFCIGLSSEGYDRLSTAHFLQDTVMPQAFGFKAVTWFGIFNVAGMLLTMAGMQLIVKKLERKDKAGSFPVLVMSILTHMIGLIVFAVTRNFTWMLCAYLMIHVVRRVNEPLLNAWLNNHLEDRARATILSTNGQVDALGQILGGPLIGIIASKMSISIGILCTVLFLLPVTGIYILTRAREHQSLLQNDDI
jgi:DHA3 family tetracycline resistance protein-like MFS transporter